MSYVYCVRAGSDWHSEACQIVTGDNLYVQFARSFDVFQLLANLVQLILVEFSDVRTSPRQRSHTEKVVYYWSMIPDLIVNKYIINKKRIEVITICNHDMCKSKINNCETLRAIN